MSNVYIRSQNREKLYQLGGNYATLEYVEYMKKGAEERHTIRIGNGCTEEIAEYESKERCIEVRAAHGRIQRGSKRVLPSIQTITEKAQLAYAQQI